MSRRFSFFFVLALIVLFLGSLAVRLLPWEHVFAEGKVYLFGPDCYVRLRKLLVYLHSFPATAVHDYFQGFPQGTGVLNPPTMEYLLAALLYPFRTHPSLTQTARVLVAFLPAALGALTVAALFRFLECRLSPVAAWIGATTLALSPYHVEATILGRFDNEMLEPLLMLLVYGLYTSTFESTSSRRAWVETGLGHILYLAIWRGAMAPLSLIGIDVLIRLVRARAHPARARRLARSAALMYVVAALGLAVICATDIWGTRTIFAFNVISWFHAAVFGAAALVLLSLGRAVANWRETSPRRRLGLLAPLTASLAGSLLVFAGPTRQALAVLGRGNPWMDSIAQYQGPVTFSALASQYGLVVFLAPFGLLLLRDRSLEQLRWKRFLILWVLGTYAAALSRGRYGFYLALSTSVMAGLAAQVLRARFWKRSPSAAWPVAALTGVLLVIQLPALRRVMEFRSGSGFSIRGDIEDTMLWLRDHTPSAGNPYRPDIRPDYGVMARWDYGAWVESVALRPSIATHGGTETHGMREAARFFLATDATEAMDLLERLDVRYAVVDKFFGDLPMYAALIGARNQYVEEKWDAELGTTVIVPKPAMLSLVPARLFFTDGSLVQLGSVVFEPVPRARLVYESSSLANVYGFPREVRQMKVFERVEGAGIHVTGVPGVAVELSMPIETNQGRRFSYRTREILGPDGSVRFTLPYATRVAPNAAGAIGPAVLSSGGVTLEISVDEVSVLEGREFALAF